MRAELCPVCHGSGTVQCMGYSSSLACHGCGGKGWVEVGNADNRPEPIHNISYSYAPYFIEPTVTLSVFEGG